MKSEKYTGRSREKLLATPSPDIREESSPSPGLVTLVCNRAHACWPLPRVRFLRGLTCGAELPGPALIGRRDCPETNGIGPVRSSAHGLSRSDSVSTSAQL